MLRKTLLASAIAALLAAPAAQAAVTFVNGLAIPGDALDLSGGTNANAGRVGFFSDLYYDRARNAWWGVSDRGPGGGTLNYETRVQRFTLDVDHTTGAISNFRIAETVKFRTANGDAFNGIAPNPPGTLGRAFDPEGLVVNARTGHFYVSDEYGPSLYEFDRQGVFVRAFTNPENVIPKVGGSPNFAVAAPDTGRRANRGYEGLAISPDGTRLYAQLQSAQMDEGGANGINARIVVFDIATGTSTEQLAYRMEGTSQGRGTSGILALDADRFLVLERNNRGIGVDSDLASPNKKVFEISLAGATDVSGVTLTNASTAAGGTVTPVVKLDSDGDATNGLTPFIDLAADTLSALGNLVPEKWEGLTIGPRLADGRWLILAGTDNDYSVTQNGSSVQFDVYFDDAGNRLQRDLDSPTTLDGIEVGAVPAGYRLVPGVLHAYAADLPGFVAQVPEPSTWALMALGLVGLGAAARRRR
jgi:hypothetical protein